MTSTKTMADTLDGIIEHIRRDPGAARQLSDRELYTLMAWIGGTYITPPEHPDDDVHKILFDEHSRRCHEADYREPVSAKCQREHPGLTHDEWNDSFDTHTTGD